MNYSLSKKFILLSLTAFLITGLQISLFVTNHIKTDKLNNIQESTLLTLDTILTPKLIPNDFQFSAPKSRTVSLNETLSNIAKSSDIFGIRIWNTESEEIFSTNIPISYDGGKEIAQALNGKIQSNFLNMDWEQPQGRSAHEVIQIFSPIALDQKIVGVYEVYTSYDIKSHIVTLNITITGITFFGLLILYIFLLRNISNASQTLLSQNESLVRQKLSLEQSYAQLDLSYRNTVMALSNAVDARDKYTARHSQRVAGIATAIGQIMEIDSLSLQHLELAALLHDIGKIGIPDEILHKPGKLSEYEFEIIRLHPSIGFNILKDINFLDSVLPIILHHHERYDGHGYPEGIKGESIPFESRIIAVADTYDAMTSDRPYRKGLIRDVAIQEIQRCAGTQFDPIIVEAFMKIDLQSIHGNTHSQSEEKLA
ncbi:putative domain HDIG-containing protein [Desulfitobacterium dichloroeliminans LMG P-21439]|uniref:Putative domain HDIG-containing protein n=1 Tax=Desulfitobacterium dichloroeliminans (strain LMG P-21439 / DCA1) TaxID=871963 RepID=L0F664_DESDL|nr:HD-GYP domain-containing protein [Desulfitobacterium dichloroeliminans]AGA68672.1 putative domain HDIG-containing protein [Desulfitobacterium dichloroeliminans LMG P-21439]